MIVEEKKIGECKVNYDDDAYKGKSEEEIQQIIDVLSTCIVCCIQQKKIA